MTASFQKNLEKIADHSVNKRINKKIDAILENPYTVSQRLMGSLKENRKTRVGKYRIIFMICKECRSQQFERFIKNRCPFCQEVPADTVIFLAVGKRSTIYK